MLNFLSQFHPSTGVYCDATVDAVQRFQVSERGSKWEGGRVGQVEGEGWGKWEGRGGASGRGGVGQVGGEGWGKWEGRGGASGRRVGQVGEDCEGFG